MNRRRIVIAGLGDSGVLTAIRVPDQRVFQSGRYESLHCDD